MNQFIVIDYTNNTQHFSMDGIMKTYYLYRGMVKDTMDEWVHYVGYTQFYHMVENGELALVTENNYVDAQ